ncbi:hypothetical protein Hamer_G015566 [Homarus americanus]|uniref:Uncharacterized protein n=1 Tax=Homarus americanus TaxID=6706 RepID=A0A8J5JIJ3_HOMAM|nr:hypothetical protein Hamer_G015566 [Homarus americanus]
MKCSGNTNVTDCGVKLHSELLRLEEEHSHWWRAYDNKESCVRKASVFCIALCTMQLVRSRFNSHLESLTWF